MILHLAWEWWLQLWPNMFAISVWTTLLLAWHHVTLKRHLTSLHDKLEKHHHEVTGKPLDPPEDVSPK